ncbi:hypothetical protein [Caldifermentibacillus hisashii]|uniref:hypothetical protein n=1 Tax=Caldifermentibacillus hisashii TaxID=996558 RepID=UPI0022B9BE03|nr:hypothetical protein [Caldifermentibacillus hisashii]
MKAKEMLKKQTKAIVVINETHSLLPEQESILTETYGDYEFLKVPTSGWTLDEMNVVIRKLTSTEVRNGKPYLDIVFVSPIPYLIMELTRREQNIASAEYVEDSGITVRVFHNDQREKKELPNGRIIQVVAKTGWQLV